MNDLPQLVAEKIDRFTGRAWVLPKILDWWERTGDRHFLLTGSPGTGKSMIIAWLAGFGPAPAEACARAGLERLRSAAKATYFCQSTALNTPRLFAETIATQFANRISGYSEALKSILDDKIQIVGHVQAGAAAPGSTLIGVQIKLSFETNEDESIFDQAFIRPLRKLYEKGYNDPILLLVDALVDRL